MESNATNVESTQLLDIDINAIYAKILICVKCAKKKILKHKNINIILLRWEQKKKKNEVKKVNENKDKENDPILLGPVKAIPPNWTVWDKITINKSMTCQELIDYIMEKYQVEANIITAGNVTIIQTFMGNAKSRLNRKIEDIYNENAKVKLSDDTKYH